MNILKFNNRTTTALAKPSNMRFTLPTTSSIFTIFFISLVFNQQIGKSQFEAAFQGRCGEDSPCEHLCFEIHDGMFECYCKEGYLLHTNGYSCIENNSTDVTTAGTIIDDGDDILYQRDASFSAVLENPNGTVVNNQQRNNISASDSSIVEDLADESAVKFVARPDGGTGRKAAVTRKPAEQNKRRPEGLSLILTETENPSSTTTTITGENGSACAKNCGPAGYCILEPLELDDNNSLHQRCQCPLGKAGDSCENDVEIRIPRFTGQGWMAFPALRAAYKHVQVEIEFRPENWDGIIFLTGERDDLAGDFISLLLYQGFVEFRFDCGSGAGVVRSDETVFLNRWNKLIIYRHRWDAWIQLNNGRHVQGRSKGLFSRITFREPVFIGGRGNTSVLTDKIPTDKGFKGCIKFLEVNGILYNFAMTPFGDAVSGFDVEECIADRCSNIPCKHGGKCLTTDETSTCLCPLGFTGDLCETRLDLQIPLFNGTSFLRYHPIGNDALSWLDLELILKPTNSDGLILYNGHRLDGVGDFIAVYMSAGYLLFTFDLGTGTATLRSSWPVTMGDWHTLRISRTGRLAVLEVDKQPTVQTIAPGAFTQLSLPLNLYLGGIPNLDAVSPKIKIKNSFVGCIQKVVINENALQILSEAVAGANIDNCPHPCLAKPCGLDQTLCVPLMESYKCLCDRNCQKFPDSEVTPLNTVVTFNGDGGFLHYVDPEINRRIISDDISINIRFRTTSVMGLILWYGSTNPAGGDFLSLGIINGYLQLIYNAGNGEVSILYNLTRVDDGHWHRVNIFREEDESSLMVDNGDAIVKRCSGPLTQINANSGLFIGGMENMIQLTHYRYHKGIVGCISDFIINSDYDVRLSWTTETSILCE